ncbi:MAG TPA: pyrroline-5-carboxylate reductase [Opitutales bacterium]|nr:pyrroline-5-carboxylate reductase [Opitutales bacterium]
MSKTAFIGAGNMASAIVRGMLNHGVKPSAIACTSAADGTGEKLASATGIGVFADFESLLKSDASISTVVLAVKPQQFAQLPASAAELTRGKLIVSILAGMTIARLAEKFPFAKNIVRAMPNTPGQIGEGISCFAPKNAITKDELAVVQSVLGAMGPVIEVVEKDLDAVTALSGSGPAYVFAFIEALRDGGIAEGLSPEIATRLAMQTVLGSAKLLEQSGETPEALRIKVTSPKGTTLAALTVMQEMDFPGLMKKAIHAAKVRSEELARGV